jgi:hypothetical protein
MYNHILDEIYVGRPKLSNFKIGWPILYILVSYTYLKLRKKNMHRQCKIILYCQPITTMSSVTPLSWYDMEGWSIFIDCQSKVNFMGGHTQLKYNKIMEKLYSLIIK